MAIPESAAEVESIKAAVSKYFPIYDVRVSYEALTFFITPNLQGLEHGFDQLRTELKPRMLIPILRYQGGEYTINVVKRPGMKTRGLWVNSILLAVTLTTTVFAGAVLWAAYEGNNDLLRLDNYLLGALFFALPLMAILGTHELSHYLAAKRCGVAASLPFFIPSIPPLGTFGAFISMRDPIPNRRALVEIGAAGPLGGLLVTIPVTLIGLWLTSLGEPTAGIVGEGGMVSIIIQPLYALFTLFIPLPENVSMHPTAFAAWVGFLVTAINLLPAGQLDGGHVARGLLGDKAKYLSYATVGMLLVLGMFYTGWLIFALLIVFLGLRHPAPLNDVTKLDNKRKILGVLTLALLLVTFSPIPLVEIAPDHSFNVYLPGGNETVMAVGTPAYVIMYVNNTGNTNTTMNMNVMQVPSWWSASLYVQGDPEANATDLLQFMIPYDEGAIIVLKVTVLSDEGAIDRALLVEMESLNSNLSTYQNDKYTFTFTFE
ncbi:MAG: site-2 protease family protein [Methanomassiliicoccales archaeon]|nr:site-2 protease family protein [Methanomassiliicoccales archaeon]